jgi:hypothetical protein
MFQRRELPAKCVGGISACCSPTHTVSRTQTGRKRHYRANDIEAKRGKILCELLSTAKNEATEIVAMNPASTRISAKRPRGSLCTVGMLPTYA